MKKLLIILAALGISATAFAHGDTYSCYILKDSAQNPILGGPQYSIELDNGDVILEVITGADEGRPLKTTEFRMEKIRQEPDLAVYSAQGVKATVGATPLNGKVRTFVSISKKIGAKTYTASCDMQGE